jgi:CcmD family protein
MPDRTPREQRDDFRLTLDGRLLRVAQQLPTTPDDEFTPIDELPPEERLPAAPMLVGAYVFAGLAIFGYLVSLSRRLAGVAREIARLEARIKRQ